MPTPLPPHYRPRPAWTPTPEQRDALQAWSTAQVTPGHGAVTEPPPGVLPWQALAWLGETQPVLLHGTGDPDISLFEPRQPIDPGAFGGQRAVFATSDGVWAMFYAVMDRVRYPMTIVNTSVRLLRDGETHGPYYYFSATDEAMRQRPFRNGWVYVLPRRGFTEEATLSLEGFSVHTHQWANPDTVRPLAKLAVRPEDFPFLEGIRSHDETILHARMREDPDGFPWAEP